MAKVELKQPIVQEVSGLLENAKTCVLVDYRGITVDVDTKLRKELREAGVTYKVYKNTLIKLAVKGTQFEELSKDLEGPTAIAVSSEDVTAPARIIAGYCKNVDALSMKSGVCLLYTSELAGTGKKTVKRYMIDRKSPAAVRDGVPGFADGSHVLWIVGYRISEEYKVTEQTRRVLQITVGGKEDE